MTMANRLVTRYGLVRSLAAKRLPYGRGMLAMDQNQLLSTVWRRDRNVIGSTAKPNLEVLLGPGEQPWITSSDDGFYSVWTSKREGDLFLLKPASQDPDRISGSASFAVVVGASSPIPKVYAFWEKRSDQGIAIVGQRIK